MVSWLLAAILLVLLWPTLRSWHRNRSLKRQAAALKRYDVAWVSTAWYQQLRSGSVVLNRAGLRQLRRECPLREDTAQLAQWYCWLDSNLPYKPVLPEPPLCRTARRWVERIGRKEPARTSAHYRNWLVGPSRVDVSKARRESMERAEQANATRQAEWTDASQRAGDASSIWHNA